MRNQNLIYIIKILLVAFQGNSAYVIFVINIHFVLLFIVQWNSTARFEWLGFISMHYFKTLLRKVNEQKIWVWELPVGTSPNKESVNRQNR